MNNDSQSQLPDPESPAAPLDTTPPVESAPEPLAPTATASTTYSQPQAGALPPPPAPPVVGTQLPVENPPEGILGFVLSLVFLFVFAPAGIISLFISRKDQSYYTDRGLKVPGLITAALVLSWIGTAFLILLLTVILGFFLIVLGALVSGAT